MRKYILASGIMVGLAAGSEYLMGRVLICKCNYLKLWHGVTYSSENSQHISDWYSFSHIIHGFILYYLVYKFLPKKSLGEKFVVAVGIEAIWEIVENSSVIINRYRESTIALDYFGDSILNSVMDIVFMMLGFWLAYKLPVKVSVFLVILMDIVVVYFIRDNLTLNVIMLLHPFEFINNWQAGN